MRVEEGKAGDKVRRVELPCHLDRPSLPTSAHSPPHTPPRTLAHNCRPGAMIFRNTTRLSFIVFISGVEVYSPLQISFLWPTSTSRAIFHNLHSLGTVQFGAHTSEHLHVSF